MNIPTSLTSRMTGFAGLILAISGVTALADDRSRGAIYDRSFLRQGKQLEACAVDLKRIFISELRAHGQSTSRGMTGEMVRDMAETIDAIEHVNQDLALQRNPGHVSSRIAEVGRNLEHIKELSRRVDLGRASSTLVETCEEFLKFDKRFQTIAAKSRSGRGGYASSRTGFEQSRDDLLRALRNRYRRSRW